MADLAGLARRAADAGIFTDFDGSLAPIVADPADSKALPGANRILAELARRFKVVAVISGRAARDLASRVTTPGVRLIGLHGMEEHAGGDVLVLPAAAEARPNVDVAYEMLREQLAGVPGAILEHKGLALAVHFRRAADPEEAEALSAPIVERVARDQRLEVIPGRLILEVRPRAGGDKGDAVRGLIRRYGLKAALFAGDDVGDLPAFHALDGLDPAVRIAVQSEESPEALIERADLVVDGPASLLSLLEGLTTEPAASP
jgi:trehalose 6-phosphate phosphatase